MDSKYYDAADQMFGLWMAADEEEETQSAKHTFIRLDDMAEVIHYPEPGPVTHVHADGTIIERRMTVEERRAWEIELDPERDIVED